ncbi:interferon-induced 35 kDa protein [Solea senegalensis]|uniref:Interferon-induced 35 kDa protein n=1 Tax=Solea senegalensis TaxID=28829 RepID=A0AAV6PMG3_SOLSE|nr:interferon-induced 35 kDa protein homolog [Solea senegalensis]KAG7473011.1 interferon-induced 35 kDa protein [Solea senegalensis]
MSSEVRDNIVTMASDEDFSLPEVKTLPFEETLDGIQTLIANNKAKYDQLIEEQNELTDLRKDHQEMTQKLQHRCDKLVKTLENEQQFYMDELTKEMVKVNSLKQEEEQIMDEIQKVEAALLEETAKYHHLREQADVISSMPEKTVAFTGVTTSATNAPTFETKSRIVYPMDGGTALITFEEEVVAKKILTLKQHKVNLTEETFITVEAEAVTLILPKLVEIESEVCPRRILISNLPKMDRETMLDKLNIHFHRRKDGGGEVESCEFLADSGTVVLTFTDKDIAKGLTDTEFHGVQLQKKKKHRVRVTPFLNGTVTKLETRMKVCPRTVLLTGIPAVMEQETLQDLLEIHFQKSVSGGGEIEACLYNPTGQQISALFESVVPKVEKKQ